jgi:hypothetical protein
MELKKVYRAARAFMQSSERKLTPPPAKFILTNYKQITRFTR